MALADEFDGFLVDLDGVVWLGREWVPGAAEALRELIDRGVEIVFVTNNSVKAPSDYAARLRDADIEVDDDRVLTGGVATAQLAVERIGRGGTAFVIGAPGFKETVAAMGLKLLGGEAAWSADAVVVSAHREFDYAELLTATRALQAGAALFATSRDPTMPMPEGGWPGTGAVLAAVETASGATATIGGKPEPPLFKLALDRLRCPLSANNAGKEQRNIGRVAMVGDRVSSDVVGGRRAGLATILVLSGATSREQAERADPRPDHVVDSIASLT